MAGTRRGHGICRGMGAAGETVVSRATHGALRHPGGGGLHPPMTANGTIGGFGKQREPKMNRLTGFVPVFGAETHTSIVRGRAWKTGGTIALCATDLTETHTRGEGVVPGVIPALAIAECGEPAGNGSGAVAVGGMNAQTVLTDEHVNLLVGETGG